MFDAKISKNARDVLDVIANYLPEGTYLAGGTALAMYINHRSSFDLDMYNPNKFNVENTVIRLKEGLPDFILSNTNWQTIMGIWKDVEISLFYYPYEMIGEIEAYKSMKVASIKDICAMKINAITSRGLKRDFYDLYYICQHLNISLLEAIMFFQNKYKSKQEFTPHILRSLEFFEDAETMPERAKIGDKEWGAIKRFFKTENVKISKELIY